MRRIKVVYIKVRLEVDVEADAQDVVSECDYSIEHESIRDAEIVDVETSE